MIKSGIGPRARVLTIVGVAGSVRPAHRLDTVPQIYLSYLQQSEPNITLLVRPQPGLDAPIDQIKRAIWSVVPAQPLYDIQPLTSVINRAMAEPRLMTTLLGSFAVLALLMSSLHAAIHAQIVAKSTLDETITSVNEYLAENTPSNRFVTLFAAELDPATGKIRYINAGHNPPLVGRSDGSVVQLGSGGLPLGIMSGAQYEAGEMELNKGEALVVYSDGVSEAVNLKEEEYGIERLTEVVRKNLSASAAGIRDKVESSLSSFTETAPANDDITLVIVKRK
jgi:hypothetical protein